MQPPKVGCRGAKVAIFPMIIFKKRADIRKWLDLQLEKGSVVGFVPTMGALHQGHVSLIETSTAKDDITVCSIFINPVQFNDKNDFQNYPVTIEQDIYELQMAGCDCLFLPDIAEIYPEGIEKAKQNKYDLGNLETILEGKYRPGHFQGVCLVVDRLLQVVQPNHLYLGQKDYQQCMVIKKLVGLINMDTKVIVCPTLREPDGLAMSSRNVRLNENQRPLAAAIFKALNNIKQNYSPGNVSVLKKEGIKLLEDSGFRVDYIEIADANDLSEIKPGSANKKAVVLAAAFLGEVRLIDNMQIN